MGENWRNWYSEKRFSFDFSCNVFSLSILQFLAATAGRISQRPFTRSSQQRSPFTPIPGGPVWAHTTPSTRAPQLPSPCIPLPPAPLTSLPLPRKTDPPLRQHLPQNTPQTASPLNPRTPRKTASLPSSPAPIQLPTPFPRIRRIRRTTIVSTRQPAYSRRRQPCHDPGQRPAQVQVIKSLFIY